MRRGAATAPGSAVANEAGDADCSREGPPGPNRQRGRAPAVPIGPLSARGGFPARADPRRKFSAPPDETPAPGTSETDRPAAASRRLPPGMTGCCEGMRTLPKGSRSALPPHAPGSVNCLQPPASRILGAADQDGQRGERRLRSCPQAKLRRRSCRQRRQSWTRTHRYRLGPGRPWGFSVLAPRSDGIRKGPAVR